ncbi:MAG TPA: SEC-C domain-containing protein [Enteractinococcus helveticum]|uniref:SEC-C domain-containing protein n=1 Tax=Enteractinococcus helveticum TaxID=1837282 RepID=A0A921K712_9MICC|nr:YchJ family metal-binding protein [Enteractinococcus helveticum]HJF14047.1 SEC-C domain-containing protein [Enteractinococcus helveticum]
MTISQDDPCPCGTERLFQHCCQPLLTGAAAPETAEALMRSRYTAFVVGDDAYLAASWHSATRPEDPSAPTGIDWRRLRIRDTVAGGPTDQTGEVEFVAHFRSAQGTRDFLHERSRFAREAGRWVYVDGELF